MGKNKRIRLLAKLPHPESPSPSKNKNSADSLFEDEDSDFNRPQELSEFKKAYLGLSSTLDVDELDYGDRNTEDDDDDWEFVECSQKVAVSQELAVEPVRQKNSADSLFDDGEDSGVVERRQRFPLSPPTKMSPAQLAIQSEKESMLARASILAKTAEVKGAIQEKEKKDIALAIAEDLAKREHFISIAGAVYLYNGKFYTLSSDDAISRLIFHKYHKEISRASPMSIIRNATALLRYNINEEFEEFPTNSHIIVFENGTLEVDSDRFRKIHRRICQVQHWASTMTLNERKCLGQDIFWRQ